MSSYGLGAAVTLTTIVTNSSGELVDPATVAVRVLRPDGTIAGPFTFADEEVTRVSLGLYTYAYPTTMAGQHIGRWETTLPDTNDEEPFDVEPLWGESGMISLSDARKHLKKAKIIVDDDEKLQGMIQAATDLIEERMGHVMAVTCVEENYAYGQVLVTNERPVISVDAITGLSSGSPITGWTVSREGVITFRSRTPRAGVQITYRAGRQPVPARFRLACKELVAHLWRTSQLNTEGGRPGIGAEIQVAQPGQFALPYNVRQLLGLDKAQRDIPAI